MILAANVEISAGMGGKTDVLQGDLNARARQNLSAKLSRWWWGFQDRRWPQESAGRMSDAPNKGGRTAQELAAVYRCGQAGRQLASES